MSHALLKIKLIYRFNTASLIIFLYVYKLHSQWELPQKQKTQVQSANWYIDIAKFIQVDLPSIQITILL